MEIVLTNLGNFLLSSRILEDLRVVQVLKTGKRIKTFKDNLLKIRKMIVYLQNLRFNFKIRTQKYQLVRTIYQIILSR
jgi:hypothetical protein